MKGPYVWVKPVGERSGGKEAPMNMSSAMLNTEGFSSHVIIFFDGAHITMGIDENDQECRWVASQKSQSGKKSDNLKRENERHSRKVHTQYRKLIKVTIIQFVSR